MPPVPPPAAREWFRHFTDEFDRSLKDDSTEVRIHDDKWAVRGREAANDPEWTHVMAIFLSRFARKMSYFQDFDEPTKVGRAGRVDFVWYAGGRESPPAVVIEHENDRNKIATNEIPNLVSYPAPLKVLIAYRYAEGRTDAERAMERILMAVGDALRQHQPPGQFLLVIGDDDKADPWGWQGFVWEADRFARVEPGKGRSPKAPA